MIPGGIRKITVPRIYPKVRAITLPALPVSGGCHLPDGHRLSLVLFSALELAEEETLAESRTLAASQVNRHRRGKVRASKIVN